jgi:hypothetical protein
VLPQPLRASSSSKRPGRFSGPKVPKCGLYPRKCEKASPQDLTPQEPTLWDFLCRTGIVCQKVDCVCENIRFPLSLVYKESRALPFMGTELRVILYPYPHPTPSFHSPQRGPRNSLSFQGRRGGSHHLLKRRFESTQLGWGWGWAPMFSSFYKLLPTFRLGLIQSHFSVTVSCRCLQFLIMIR